MRTAAGRLMDRTPASAAFSAAAWGTVRIEYDFSDTSKITSSGGAVSQVDQESGSLTLSLTAAGTRQPTTGTRSKNSLNVLDFDGTSDQLISGTNAGLWTRPFTQVAVLKADIVTTSEMDFLEYDGSVFGTRKVGTTNYVAWNSQYLTSSGTVDTNYHILIATIQTGPATSTLYVDGTSAATATNLGGGTGSKMYVGSEVGLSRFWDGTGAHIIVYDGVIANPAGLDAALNTKWAVH